MTPKLVTLSGLLVICVLAAASLAGQVTGAVILSRSGSAIVNTEFIVLAICFEVLAFLVIIPIFYQFYAYAQSNYSLAASFALTFQGFSFAKLVPFGDYMIWRHSLRRKLANIGIALEYVVLLYVLGIGALLGLFLILQFVVTILYPAAPSNDFLIAVVRIPIAIAIFIFLILLFSKTVWLKKRIQSFFRKYFGESAKTPLAILRDRDIPLKQAVCWVFLMVLSWILEATSYFFSMQAAGADIPYLLGVYAYSFVRLFIMLPLFPGGIGEVEATSTALFSSYGYDPLLILSGSLLFRFLTFWLPLTIALVTLLPVMLRHKRVQLKA